MEKSKSLKRSTTGQADLNEEVFSMSECSDRKRTTSVTVESIKESAIQESFVKSVE
jgi:hypothetical protein